MSPIQGGIVLVQARATSTRPPMSSSSESAVTFALFVLYGFHLSSDKHKREKVTGRRPVATWRNSEQCGSILYDSNYDTYIHIYFHTT